MRIRTYLVLLVLAALVPLLAFSVLMVVHNARDEHEAVARGFVETTKALSLSFERQVEATIETLQTLATSEALDAGDLDAFYRQCLRVGAAHRDWMTVVLVELAGRQIFNLLEPLGTPLPSTGAPGFLKRVVETGRPTTSGVFRGRVSGAWMVATAVPVVRNGRTKYVLAAGVSASVLSRVLAQQGIPPDWVGTVLDSEHVIVARTRDPDRHVGRRAPEPFIARISGPAEGSFQGTTGDGLPVYTAFSRSALSGWTVLLAIPVASVDAHFWRSLWALGAVGLVLTVAGAALAFVVGRRIATGIMSLSGTAEALGRGEAPILRAFAVAEVNKVATSLMAAGANRGRAEAALRESERHYRQVVDTAGEGIWMIDGAARTSYVNERMATMLGYEPGEMLGRPLYDFVDAETRPAVARGLMQLKPGVVDRHDLRFRRKDGSPLWTIVATTPGTDDQGRILGTFGMVTDITERRRAQKSAQALAEVGREIAASLDVAQVTDRIVSMVLRLLSARRSTLWLLDATSGALVCIATASEPDEPPWIGRVLPPGTSIAGRAVTLQQPVRTEDVFEEPGLALPDWIVERLRAERCRAIAAAPLRVRGEVLGVLSLGDSIGRVFTDEELRLLAAFADMSAVALKNARLYEAERVRAIRQGTLARLNQVVSSSLNLDQTLEAIATAAGELLGTSSVGVCIADEAAGILTRPAVFTDVYSQEDFRFGEGLVGWVAAHRQPVNVPDVFADERVFSRDWFRAQGFRSALAIPIVADGSLLGVLSFVGQRSFVIEPDTQDLMNSFVGQAAAAIRNAQLHAETERRRREAEALERSARMLAENLDSGDVGRRSVESVGMLFHAKSSSLRLLEPDGRLRLLAVSGQDADHYAPGHFLPPDEGTLAAAIAAARPVRALDVLTDPAIRLGLDLRARIERSGERSALAVPLRAKGAVIGALGVNDVLGRTFSDADAALLQAFADHAAVALENARLHQRMQSARARLAVLSRRLLEVQETEHRNLARELHDGIGQALTAVKLNLQLLQPSPLDAASTRIQESIEIVDGVLEQVRDLSLSLRPSVLDDLGLVAALRWYVRREAERAGLEADLDVEPLEPRQAPEIETTCFRIVQEAVTNVIRHAKAGRLSVKLTRRDGELELTVRDDGVGFDVDQAHARAALGESLGLLGMEERATLVGGRLEIQSAEGLGATVRVRLPVAMREGT